MDLKTFNLLEQTFAWLLGFEFFVSAYEFLHLRQSHDKIQMEILQQEGNALDSLITSIATSLQDNSNNNGGNCSNGGGGGGCSRPFNSNSKERRVNEDVGSGSLPSNGSSLPSSAIVEMLQS